MEVRATKPGFYAQYRNENDTFDVADGAKASWFEPTKAPAKDGAKGKAAKSADSDEAKAPAKDGESQS